MAGNLAVNRLLLQWMIRKVRNCCETCENLVCVATTIGQLQHSEYVKPTFLDTFKWAIRPVFPETVTFDKFMWSPRWLQGKVLIASYFANYLTSYVS